MISMTAIIVDDEPHCIHALENLLKQYFPQVQLLDTCTSGQDAARKLISHHTDLVFLDIEMPSPNGFELLQMLGNQFVGKIIFTTAYSQYAVKAFRYAASNFLLKPITEQDLRQALTQVSNNLSLENRAKQLNLLFETLHMGRMSKSFDKIALPSSTGFEIIALSQVAYIEADQRYSLFHLSDERKILVTRNIGEYEEILDPDIFLRIHRSYIVNLNYIKKYVRGEGGQVQMKTGICLDVSKSKKEDLMLRLGVKS